MLTSRPATAPTVRPPSQRSKSTNGGVLHDAIDALDMNRLEPTYKEMTHENRDR
jgi:hypothetical protein